jgi:hypothetical protein
MLVMNSLLIAFPVLHRSGLQFSRNESIYTGEWGTISTGYERRIGRHCCFQELQEVCIYSYPLSRKPSVDMRLSLGIVLIYFISHPICFGAFRWGNVEFPLPFGRVLSSTESFIHSLDEKVIT